MFLFIHEGKGHYIGSTVVVLAPSKVVAEDMVREVLDEYGLSNEELNVVSTINTSYQQVAYVNDGDY